MMDHTVTTSGVLASGDPRVGYRGVVVPVKDAARFRGTTVSAPVIRDRAGALGPSWDVVFAHLQAPPSS
jgi:hypothetical protein